MLLPDPLELLKGEGKQVRYVPIREQDDIEERAFAELIQAALDLPPWRDAKLGMIRGGFRAG